MDITFTQENCVDEELASVQINTLVTYACKQRTNATDGSQFYSCEPFAEEQALFAFPLTNPGEREDEDVQYRGETTTKKMTPLKYFPEGGSSLGEWRSFSPRGTFTFFNARYDYDRIYDMHRVMVSSESNEVTDSDVLTIQTNAELTSTAGVHYLQTMKADALKIAIENDIDFKVIAATMIHDHANQWFTYPDFGATRTTFSMGADPQGNQVAKSDRLSVAFVDKNCNIPIETVVRERSTQYTGTAFVNGTQTVEVLDYVVTGSVLNQLPRNAFTYVSYYDEEQEVYYGAKDDEIGLNVPYKIGYVYCAVPANPFPWATLYVPERNPHWNALHASRYLDQNAVRRSAGTSEESTSFYCGDTISRNQLLTQEEITSNIVDEAFGLGNLTSELVDFWEERKNLTLTNNATGLLLMSVYDAQVNLIASSLGCRYRITNFQDPEAIFDQYRIWWIPSVNETSGDIDIDALTESIRPFVAARNRAMCGNCILVPLGNGSFTTDVPGVSNICDPALGTTQISNRNTASTFDITMSSKLPFCYDADRFIIRNIPEQNLLSYQLRRNEGKVTMKLKVPKVDDLFQIEARGVCPISTNTLSVFGASSYQMNLTNAFDFVVQYEVRVRLNETKLIEDPETSNGCDTDVTYTIGAERNVTELIPICPDVENYIQVYNLNGEACSIVFPASQSFTATQLQADQSIIDRQNAYRDGSFNITQQLAEIIVSLGQQVSSISQQLQIQGFQLQESIVNFNANITNVDQVLVQTRAETASIGAALTNVDTRLSDTEIIFVSVNISLANTQALVDQVQEAVEIQATQLEGVNTVLSDVYNKSEVVNLLLQANLNGSIAFDNITDTLRELNQRAIDMLQAARDVNVTVESVGDKLESRHTLDIGLAIGIAVMVAIAATAVILASVALAKFNHDPGLKMINEFIKQEKMETDLRNAKASASSSQPQPSPSSSPGKPETTPPAYTEKGSATSTRARGWSSGRM